MRVVLIGDSARGPGHIERPSRVVVDPTGRYWLGQSGSVRIFDARGAYQDKLDFRGAGDQLTYPQPINVDDQQRIRVIDQTRTSSTVDPTTLLVIAREPLPVWPSAVHHLRRGEDILNAWLDIVDGNGQPLHILQRGRIEHSFGAAPEVTQGPLDAFESLRVMGNTADDALVTSRYYDYRIELWTPRGRRVTGLFRPGLNSREPKAAAYNYSNPPLNRVAAVRVDASDRVWVVRTHLKPTWRHAMTEIVDPAGNLGLALTPGHTLNDVYDSQIDVIELWTGATLASQTVEGVFFDFVDDKLAELVSLSDGSPQLGLSTVRYAAP